MTESDEFERRLFEECRGTEEILHIKEVSDVIRSLKPSLVLDAGCGEGWISFVVQREGYSVVACDLSESQLMRAKDLLKKSKANLPLVLSSLTHLPFREECYDSIICLHVIEHIPNMKLALKECYRVLKRGGRLCLATPGLLHGVIYDKMLLKLPFSKFILRKLGLPLDTSFGQPHVHLFSHNSFNSMLENSGFEVTRFYNLAFLGSYMTTIKHLFKILFGTRLTRLMDVVIYVDVRRACGMPLALGTSWMLICTRSQS